MTHTINLDHYFARIGYQGPRTPTLEVLQEIHRLHPAAIAFENLAPITRQAVKLDVASIEAKLVHERRGGYCFEQNTLLANVLMQLGFKVTPLLARVVWGRAPDAIAPRTHMVLRVEIAADAWIADVGFGGVTLTAPLRLSAGLAQQTPHGTFRLADAARESLYLEVLGPDSSWARIYRFDLQPVEWIDYEVSNWYTSAAPDSIFLSNLIVCRVSADTRLALFNDRFSVRAASGEVLDERPIANGDELGACLRERFGIDVGAAGIDSAALFERVRAAAERG